MEYHIDMNSIRELFNKLESSLIELESSPIVLKNSLIELEELQLK